MKTLGWIVTAFAVLALAPGCATDDAGGTATSPEVRLCGDCGHVKGGEMCCDEGAAKCGCNMHKDSPGCCKMEKGEDVTLCSGCGHIEGTDACCEEGAEMCECGWAKGSPACCKIEKP